MMSSRKDVILDTATELFNREGFQAVGIDKLITAAGVSKLTLYRHFASKDELIEIILNRQNSHFLAELTDAIQKHDVPRLQLRAFFTFYESWFNSDTFRGYMSVNAVLEFGDRSPALVAINRSLHEALIATLSQILQSWVKRARAQHLAWSLIMLIDGAIIARISWGQSSDYSPAHTAWSMAKTLLDAEGIEL